MTVMQPFNPAYLRSREITVTTVGGSTVIDGARGSKNSRFLNMGANVIWLRWWDSRNGVAPAAVAATGATLGDFPVAPGQAATITKDQDHDTLCWIAETGNTRALVSLGEGW